MVAFYLLKYQRRDDTFFCSNSLLTLIKCTLVFLPVFFYLPEKSSVKHVYFGLVSSQTQSFRDHNPVIVEFLKSLVLLLCIRVTYGRFTLLCVFFYLMVGEEK